MEEPGRKARPGSTQENDIDTLILRPVVHVVKSKKKKIKKEKFDMDETIRIQKKRHNFVLMDKGFLNDNRLSFKAKGILAYLLSKPDNWHMTVPDLINHAQDKKSAIYAGLKELKAAGYFSKKPVRINGRVAFWDSVIYEDPADNPEFTKRCAALDEATCAPMAAPTTVLKQSLPDFQEIENQKLLPDFREVENVETENRDVLVINDYTKNESILQSCLSSQSDRKTDMTWTEDKSNHKKPACENESPPAEVESYSVLLERVRSQVDYPALIQTENPGLVNNLIWVMMDVVMTHQPSTMKIGRETKTLENIKQVYWQLNDEHIRYVIHQFQSQRGRIKKKTAYLRAMLYNSLHELEAHFVNAVRADGAL
jgi:hypothetical protein